MIALLVSGPCPDPRPRNWAPCGCDGHGQIHYGEGALHYVTLCTDRDCCERRDAAFMGVSAEDIAAYFPRRRAA